MTNYRTEYEMVGFNVAGLQMQLQRAEQQLQSWVPRPQFPHWTSKEELEEKVARLRADLAREKELMTMARRMTADEYAVERKRMDEDAEWQSAAPGVAP